MKDRDNFTTKKRQREGLCGVIGVEMIKLNAAGSISRKEKREVEMRAFVTWRAWFWGEFPLG
jgi:hypothetical protein